MLSASSRKQDRPQSHRCLEAVGPERRSWVRTSTGTAAGAGAAGGSSSGVAAGGGCGGGDGTGAGAVAGSPAGAGAAGAGAGAGPLPCTRVLPAFAEGAGLEGEDAEGAGFGTADTPVSTTSTWWVTYEMCRGHRVAKKGRS